MNMGVPNPLREALTSGTFSYMVELVASASTPEDQSCSMPPSDLLQVPGVIAAGVTSYAGGSEGMIPFASARECAAAG